MNYIGTRTDLAIELAESLSSGSKSNYPAGINVIESGTENIKVTRIEVTSKEGETAIGKPQGNYITIEIPHLRDDNFEEFDSACKILSEELLKIMNLENRKTVLIVGLGNWNITPDALGPKVVSQVIVTRHFLQFSGQNLEPELLKLRPVCAISPGVLGITGIETFEIVRGVVDRVNPALIIVIDSLASRKADRISTTIQIADTGIAPGSGVGNKRTELTRETLGRPVIAIGVPTVIDAATLAGDAINLMFEDIKNKNFEDEPILKKFEEIVNSQNQPASEVINRLTSPYLGSMIVTPKEIDEIIKRISGIIADGINLSLGTQTYQ